MVTEKINRHTNYFIHVIIYSIFIRSFIIKYLKISVNKRVFKFGCITGYLLAQFKHILNDLGNVKRYL